MNALQLGLAYIGRILLSAVFLISSVCEIIDWNSTEQFFLQQVAKWTTIYPTQDFLLLFIEEINPWLPWILLSAVAMKIIGSLMLVFNYQVRLGSLLLLFFLIPTTLIVHDFWDLDGAEKVLNMTMFFKNGAVVGGLMVVLAFGKGGFSTAKSKSKPKAD